VTAALDPFIPAPDVRERFSVEIRAPAALVMEEARSFDLQSLPLVKLVFRLRERLMGASPAPRVPQGIVAETRSLGWGTLVEEPDRLLVCGARCQPWLAEVTFRAIPVEEFAGYQEPGQVKIGWTLEAEALGPARTRFSHETRVLATDEESRRRFRRYWRWARVGIIGIRLLLMPAIRRRAEHRWQEEGTRGRVA
jgi:hypothetical protein